MVVALTTSGHGVDVVAAAAGTGKTSTLGAFAFITDLMGSAVTYLYGRRIYDTMAVWETDAALGAQSDLMSDFSNVWQAADKVVYSTTLAPVSTANARLERHFYPGAVHDLKAAARSDLIVGGPNLAAQAFKAGLVEECHLFVWPVVLGGAKPALPTGRRAELAPPRRAPVQQRRRTPPPSPAVGSHVRFEGALRLRLIQS